VSCAEQRLRMPLFFCRRYACTPSVQQPQTIAAALWRAGTKYRRSMAHVSRGAVGGATTFAVYPAGMGDYAWWALTLLPVPGNNALGTTFCGTGVPRVGRGGVGTGGKRRVAGRAYLADNVSRKGGRSSRWHDGQHMRFLVGAGRCWRRRGREEKQPVFVALFSLSVPGITFCLSDMGCHASCAAGISAYNTGTS